MLLADFIKKGVSELETLYSAEEARSIIMILCEDLLGTKSYTHIVEPEYTVPSGKEAALEAAMQRLRSGEPVQYVTGKAQFCGRFFNVDSNVLIPRQETEQLCKEAIEQASRIARMRKAYGDNSSPVRILDLCTGSGCIAWTVALGVPGAEVVAVDISGGALGVASGQDFSAEMKESGAVAPVFVKADVLDTEQSFDYGSFDFVFSNPPYIMESEKEGMRQNVLGFEPFSALFVTDEDPLVFYRAVAKWSSRFMSKDGMGISEINETLGDATLKVFTEEGFRNSSILSDFFGKSRFVVYKR